MKKTLPALLLFIFISLSSTSASADSKSDYEYQLSQYRRSYTEFTQLKRDYLQNRTLDNQQKSIIIAKQALLARDLAKAAYARYLTDLITQHNTNYVGFESTLTRLSSAVSFYTLNSTRSQAIATPADLKTFSDEYVLASIIPDRSFYYGQEAAKLAQLIRFHLDAQKIFDSIRPKITQDGQPIPLKARLQEIPILAEEINQKIATQAALIIPKVEEKPISGNDYFSEKIKTLTQIRSLQTELVDLLVDIDLNYAQL